MLETESDTLQVTNYSHFKKNMYLFVFIDCAGSLIPFWILLIVAVHGLSLAVGSGEHC